MKTDIHCHLTHNSFKKDLDFVVKRAKDVLIITSGVNLEDDKEVLELCRRYKNVKAGLGLYPIDGLRLDEKGLNESLSFIKRNKNRLLYLGEAGLDYKESDDKKKQKEIFFRVIELAEKIKKPLLVHSREAELDCVKMLEKSSLKKIIFHCFTGGLDLAKRIEGNGWSFSIPCNIVKSGHFQELAKIIDISRLFTETDSPFLSPGSGRNEPGFVVESIKKIAEIKKLDIIETENILYANFQKMFL